MVGIPNRHSISPRLFPALFKDDDYNKLSSLDPNHHHRSFSDVQAGSFWTGLQLSLALVLAFRCGPMLGKPHVESVGLADVNGFIGEISI